ncbi:MAG: DUF364 domain-containing protein [Anaerolineae bacterium]
MNIIDDLIASLRGDAPLREVRVCAFWTAVVLEDGRCGLASTLRPDEPQCAGPTPLVPRAGRLLEYSALELAEYAKSESLLEASIGLAAINALLEVDESRCVELNAEEVILEQGTGRKVAIVGHFPFIPRVREVAEELWVLEKRPVGGDLPADMAAEVLPQADVAAITGTSLINHTFEGLMKLCRPGALVIVLGPTAPLSPVLFDYGADIICGTLVTDAENVLRLIGQGANFGQVKRGGGVRLLTMARTQHST